VKIPLKPVFSRAVLSAIAGVIMTFVPSTAPAAGLGSGRVPIAVRVSDGGKFVPGLTMADFEVSDGGLTVAPEALVEIRRNSLARREGAPDATPDLSRRIVVLFQLTEYHPKIPEALAALLEAGLRPGDVLEVQTPMKNYKLTAESFAAKPVKALIAELTDLVKKDIIQGGMGYNSVMRELRTVVRRIAGAGRTSVSDGEGDVDTGLGLESQLRQYSNSLQKMESMRSLEQARLESFARSLKSQPGRKIVHYVYQREFRPEITPQTVNALLMNNQDKPSVMSEVQELFQNYHRTLALDARRLKETFADSGAQFNFLFINRDPERISGIIMKEQSEDVFKALSVAADATGGVTSASQNPAAAMAEAVKAGEDGYILYYTPAAAAPAGTFMPVTVSVKGKGYKVFHRAGYFSGR
jgi:hypothetical protein